MGGKPSQLMHGPYLSWLDEWMQEGRGNDRVLRIAQCYQQPSPSPNRPLAATIRGWVGGIWKIEDWLRGRMAGGVLTRPAL
jgi:hypothetical protein